tara:strand:+ start:662 stop:1066 length:405 start_codon:yes stop_codon:yes gene_type:complete
MRIKSTITAFGAALTAFALAACNEGTSNPEFNAAQIMSEVEHQEEGMRFRVSETNERVNGQTQELANTGRYVEVFSSAVAADAYANMRLDQPEVTGVRVEMINAEDRTIALRDLIDPRGHGTSDQFRGAYRFFG